MRARSQNVENLGVSALVVPTDRGIRARGGTPGIAPKSKGPEPFSPGPCRSSRSSLSVLLRFRERAIDELLELRERLGAAHEVAVDHERGRAGNAGIVADLRVGVDLRLVGVVVEPRLELVHVAPELLGVLLERGALETVGRALVLAQEVVHLPESVRSLLLEGFVRGLGCEGRVGVHGERLVTPDELYLVAVGVGDLLHRRLHPTAERALKLAELLAHALRLFPTPQAVGPLRPGQRL